jgi:hypothetical protein
MPTNRLANHGYSFILTADFPACDTHLAREMEAILHPCILFKDSCRNLSPAVNPF